MKRIVALFLTFMLLLASTHATLAFHYCGKELHSIGIVEFQKVSCCKEKSHSGENTLQKKSCCSNQYLKISTDDYSANQQITIGSPKDFHSVAFVSCPEWGLNNVFNTTPFQRVFPPPRGLIKSGIERLIFICIFRI